MHKDVCSRVYTAALFVLAKSQKGPKSLQVGWLINKLWYIHVLEFFELGENKYRYMF